MVAQRSPKPQVAGSSPVCPAGPAGVTRSDADDLDEIGQPRVNSSQNAPSTPRGADAQGSGSKNPFLAIGLFIRQILAELRKVVVPTRRELVQYSITVLLFVVFMILLILGLDAAFSWLSRIAFTVPDL